MISTDYPQHHILCNVATQTAYPHSLFPTFKFNVNGIKITDFNSTSLFTRSRLKHSMINLTEIIANCPSFIYIRIFQSHSQAPYTPSFHASFHSQISLFVKQIIQEELMKLHRLNICNRLFELNNFSDMRKTYPVFQPKQAWSNVQSVQIKQHPAPEGK